MGSFLVVGMVMLTDGMINGSDKLCASNGWYEGQRDRLGYLGLHPITSHDKHTGLEILSLAWTRTQQSARAAGGVEGRTAALDLFQNSSSSSRISARPAYFLGLSILQSAAWNPACMEETLADSG